MEAKKTFTEIGKGTFGIIFEDTSQTIIKRTLNPNWDPRKWLTQDAKWHARICTSREATLGKYLHITHVPKFLGLKREPGEDGRWLDASATFEDLEYRTTSPMLHAQRIPAVPQSTSTIVLERLVELDQEVIQHVLESAQNQNCLFRIYFGKLEPERVRRLTLAPSLRNFSLGRTRLAACLSKEDYLRLLRMLARTMAYLHWYIGCDARDVEFVLGGVDDSVQDDATYEILGQQCTAWLLDFNQVTEISMDAAGAEKAAKAFLDNDPYFPKAYRDTDDWYTFKSAYLDTGEKIQAHKALDDDIRSEDCCPELPSIFCATVERTLHSKYMA